MRVIDTVSEMRDELRLHRLRDDSIGFVPTMGALHEGHMSLVRRSVDENDITVMSIFVNPTQFQPGEDFETYPRTLREDLAQAEEEGVDIVFTPTAKEMYTPRYQSTVYVQQLSDHLCGMSRGRGHFVGVCSVVSKLFNIVQPTRAYFGQKDAQQAVIIQRMVEDLNFPVEIIACPIVREEDGLAMSSRNAGIPPQLRQSALALRRALTWGRKMIQDGERDSMKLLKEMAGVIESTEGADADYLHIVSPATLEDVDEIEDMVLIAGAIKVGEVRLMDNIIVGPDGPWED